MGALNRPIEYEELCGPGPFVPEAPRVPPPVWRSGPALEILLWIITLGLLFSLLGRAELALGPEAATALAARGMLQQARLRPIPEDLRLAGAAPISAHLAALSSWIFEFTGLAGPEFAARLPSALFALLQIGCVRGIARRAAGIRARRLAHLALIFMPGWLAGAREAGPASMTIALLLMGLAMTIAGTTDLMQSGPERVGEGGGLRARVAPAGAWFAAGCLWGLAAFAEGPVAFLVLIPALLAPALLPREKGSRALRATLLGFATALPPIFLLALAGAALFPAPGAAGAVAAPLEQIAAAFRTLLDEAAHPLDLADRAAAAARAFPVGAALALGGLAYLLGSLRVRLVPVTLLWAALCLALAALAPRSAPWAARGLWPAAAIFIGIGLLAAFRPLMEGPRRAGAAALAALVVAAGAWEFARHYRPAPARKPEFRALARGLAPFLAPGEPVGVLGFPPEAFEFYLNPLGGPARDARALARGDWDQMAEGKEPEAAKGIRFVLIPPPLAPAAPADRRWHMIGGTEEMALLERAPEAPAAP